MKLSVAALLAATLTTPAALADEEKSERLSDIESRLQALEKTKISGSFRFNYFFNDNNEDAINRGGDTTFNVFTLGVDTESKGIELSAQYRWYGFADMVHHFELSTDLSEEDRLTVGITKVPFGILPYESNNWWFGIPYYLGYNDDYDTGIKYIKDSGHWNIQAALFLGTEYGDGNADRYSYDVLTDGDDASEQNTEANQVNVRVAYSFDHGEVGASLQYGQLYNNVTDKNGDNIAFALHHLGDYGNFHSQVQFIRYEYNPENGDGVRDDVITVGAFADKFTIAVKSNVYSLNLAYDVPVDLGAISNLRFYNDYSHQQKDEKDFTDSQLNATGVAITAGAIYAYVEVFASKNVLYLSGGRDAFAEGSADDWDSRFNFHVGYYF